MAEKIELNAADRPLDRAAKIWRLIGFQNDRLGQVAMMAAYLSAYRDLDEAAAWNAAHGQTSEGGTGT